MVTTSKPKSCPKQKSHKEANIPVVEIHENVNIVQPLLERVGIIGFSDFHLQDATQFPDFQFDYYTELTTLPNGNESVQPKPWAKRLYKSRVMALLDLPHFGQSTPITCCVRFPLSQLHGGYLWLDKPYLWIQTHCIGFQDYYQDKEKMQLKL